MEKRTILAFVLSFIILIGWSYFFAPKKDHAPEKQRNEDVLKKKAPVEKTKVPKSEEKIHPELSKPLTPQAPEKVASGVSLKIVEKEIEIDTPLYRAVFSNVGPSIRSFKLKKYRGTTDPRSPLIELVTLEKKIGSFLHIGFENPLSTQGENTVYKVNDQAIRLGPQSSPKNLEFSSIAKNGLAINYTYRFYPDQYTIDIKIDVINQSIQKVKGAFTADIKAFPPEGKKSYYSYVGLVALLDNKLKEVKIKKESEEKILTGQIEWMGYENDYFISTVIPEKASKGIFKGRISSSGLLKGTYMHPSISIDPSQQQSMRYSLYLGPRDLYILKQHGKNLARAVNFGWTDIVARPLLYTLRFFNQYIHNYGVSIILITIVIKIIFWPLTHKSYKSMGEMKKLQPMMAKIKEKYKNDKQQMNKEMMGLYKTYKVNPMSGCLPMIIQIPVFFALFRVLGSAIELRHEPFILWINELFSPDRLFSFPFHVPFMAPPFGIPVLTLLMGASMFLQQKMTPTPGDPTQAKLMMFLPLIFTFMFINFPSGLVLYWLVNNILSIGQQYRVQKKIA